MVKTNLEKSILKEGRALRMKTKFTRAKEGDANTKLFHSLMNARKAKNVITKIELEDVRFVDQEDDIVHEIIGFFQRLYKMKGLSFRGIDGIEWQPIPPHLADWLEKPFKEEKIKREIFKCEGNKGS